MCRRGQRLVGLEVQEPDVHPGARIDLDVRVHDRLGAQRPSVPELERDLQARPHRAQVLGRNTQASRRDVIRETGVEVPLVVARDLHA